MTVQTEGKVNDLAACADVTAWVMGTKEGINSNKYRK
jgi:hypothetical protein